MNALLDLPGISLPVIQAPMAGFQGSALAIAVSGTGALGSLACATLSPDTMRAEMRAIAAAGAHPYNVNFFCHTMPPPDPAREAAWGELLAPYYAELDIDPGSIPAPAQRMPFDAAAADVIEELRPPIVSFHFGLPAEDLLARVRATGARILSSATTVEEALWLESRGVDGIIAQGLEAGGHRGNFLTHDMSTQSGTLALLPQVARAVRLPVIAAGGIADAAGVAAAIALGASAVQLGTAYLLCPEAATTPVHCAALASDASHHTALTNLFSGRLARGIINRLMRDLGPVNPAAPDYPYASAALAPLRARAEAADRSDFSPLWSGQNTTGCKPIPAAELTRELVSLID